MDDGHIWLELIIIILLVLGNAVCSLAEIAIVGARKTKLQELIDEGNKSAVYALRLAEEKEELFATIQVGITTISIITGMFSGASLAGPLASEMEKVPLLAPYAREISMVTVMVLVTYFSLIIGELAPKWIAIAVPEKAACVIARPMIIMATVCRPLVWFSTWSTKIVVGFLGVKMGGEQPVSEEEIKVLLQQGARLGTFDKEEPEIIDNVFELNDRTASDCMTARPQLDWLDLEDEEKKIWADMMESSHFRLPVGKGSLDDFKGLADVSEILIDQHKHPGKPLKASIMDTIHQPLFIPETLILTKLLQLFRTRGVHEAIVIDEYGTLSGLVTLHDVLEEIVGDMPGDKEDEEKKIWADMMESSHFRLPVGKGSLDDFKGLADVSEILIDQHKHPGKPLKASIMDTIHQPLFIPETLILTKLLQLFRTRGVHEAIVIDEYGTLSGLVTLHDVLEEIVGDMPGDKEDILEEQNKFIRRGEHAWLVEGLCSIDDFREHFHIEGELPGEKEAYYKTLGGFLTYLLGYIPKETEKVTYGRFTFEIVDCDNRRIDKVLVTEGTASAKE